MCFFLTKFSLHLEVVIEVLISKLKKKILNILTVLVGKVIVEIITVLF